MVMICLNVGRFKERAKFQVLYAFRPQAYELNRMKQTKEIKEELQKTHTFFLFAADSNHFRSGSECC